MDNEYDIYHTKVFPFTNTGGNPCPIVFNANNLTTEKMLAVARFYNLESGFIQEINDSYVSLRYFVPKYEMEMCVHATIGSLCVYIPP